MDHEKEQEPISLSKKAIPTDIITAITKCKPESAQDVFPEYDPKCFATFDQMMLAHVIAGSGRRRVVIIKDVPLSKAIELTENGQICNYSVLGNFRGKESLKMTDGTRITPPTFYNCMCHFEPGPVPDPDVTVDAYLADTKTLITLSSCQALYYEP